VNAVVPEWVSVILALVVLQVTPEPDMLVNVMRQLPPSSAWLGPARSSPPPQAAAARRRSAESRRMGAILIEWENRIVSGIELIGYG
jgi:hypothetical protein